jgi:predicted ATP-grasp superfamily ATP-dependent carboligase
MFALGSLVRSPFNGFITIAQRIQEAVDGQAAAEAVTIKNTLSEMYMQLDSGRMTAEEFEEREKTLLDRLDEIESHGMDLSDNASSDDDN